MTESIHDNGGADEPLVGSRLSFDEQAACLAQELDSFSRQPEEDARIEALIREDIASRIGTGLDFDVVVLRPETDQASTDTFIKSIGQLRD
jgi:hypothetical protein